MSIKKKHIIIIVGGLLVLIILLVAAFFGYKKYLAPKETSQSTVPRIEKDVPAISSKEDLSQAVDQLNEIDTGTKQEENSLRQLVK